MILHITILNIKKTQQYKTNINKNMEFKTPKTTFLYEKLTKMLKQDIIRKLTENAKTRYFKKTYGKC